MLGFYSHHGEAIAVPDLRGLSVKDAVTRAEKVIYLLKLLIHFFYQREELVLLSSKPPRQDLR